ncbi:MAG: zinc ribbon domain-containing protein [Planctomycetia bacterium]|nr:zinc ribbon domain-containing protein [Planctomycetia bacterium]
MADTEYVAEIVCPHCTAGVPAGATACPRCGAVIDSPTNSQVQPATDPAPKRLDERRWVVVGLMVFAALFLGFPVLWKSRGFSRGEKIFWTVFVLIETVLVFWAFFWVMAWSIDRFHTGMAGG